MARNNLARPKLPTPSTDASDYERQLYSALVRELNDHADQVNALAEGKIVSHYNAESATPSTTTIPHEIGDFIKNRAPTELGTASAMYVVIGFSCISAGTPGQFVEVRCLTGN